MQWVLQSLCFLLNDFLAFSYDGFQRGHHHTQPISQLWGQYSPWFAVPSEISTVVPPQCQITFAQVLSRHGSRDPTASRSAVYNTTIQDLIANVSLFTGKYSFLNNYTYTLGVDQLTTFGQQEMVTSGQDFYLRYEQLATQSRLFVRASGETRVVQSALNWTQGYYKTSISSGTLPWEDQSPYKLIVISEAEGSNNTLSNELCTAFRYGPASRVAAAAQQTFAQTFVPSITKRLNMDMSGAQLTDTDTISLMDMCPFSTVASVGKRQSHFCNLFSSKEWHSYNYYLSLNKFYGYSNGNPLAPTKGVGWTNELIARLTGKPVQDHTSVNQTLDNNPETFPVGPNILFADFSHDNDMASIFAALGLYNSTTPLSNTAVQETNVTNGYSAAWTVPFAARMYVEKLRCNSSTEELIRIIVNDRVIPLTNCDADSFGMCTLSKFISSLSFARAGGHWQQCFN